MGVNEFDLLGTRRLHLCQEAEVGLIGMTLRLALERADSAESAIEVITDLLASTGKGQLRISKDFRYDNTPDR